MREITDHEKTTLFFFFKKVVCGSPVVQINKNFNQMLMDHKQIKYET